MEATIEVNSSAMNFMEKAYIAGKTHASTKEHNRMNGTGVIRWQNGDSYEGSFRNDKMHGDGVYRAKDGCVSTGQW
jgi:hypothetical protein